VPHGICDDLIAIDVIICTPRSTTSLASCSCSVSGSPDKKFNKPPGERFCPSRQILRVVADYFPAVVPTIPNSYNHCVMMIADQLTSVLARTMWRDIAHQIDVFNQS